MTSLNGLPLRDLESLSAYLDGELTASEAARLEARLEAEPSLKAALDELRATSRAVRSLPALRVPRNFTLTPQMAGIRQRRPAYPVLRLAAALATVGFVLVSGLDVLGRGLILRAGAPAASFETSRMGEQPGEQVVLVAASPTQEAAAPAAALGVEDRAVGAGEAAQTPLLGAEAGGAGAEGTPLPPAAQAEEATAAPTEWGVGGGPTEVAAPIENQAFAGMPSPETPLPAPTATAAPATETSMPAIPPAVPPMPATAEPEEVAGPTVRLPAVWALLRWAEIVLGGAAVILSVFSLRLRRNR